MEFQHAAFLSYSHRDKPWVKTLQAHLEAALRAHGPAPHTVFRDETDLAPGRSWVTGLQAGVDLAPVLILVVTPESMASPRVEDEWNSVVAKHPDWKKGRLQVVRLVDCPLPPFLEQLGYIDLRDHDEAAYREGLAKLLAALRPTGDLRQTPDLPDDLVPPDPPRRVLTPALRRPLVEWLVSLLEQPVYRAALATALSLEGAQLAPEPSAACAASALLVRYPGNDDPRTGLLRMLGLIEAMFASLLPDQVEVLRSIRQDVEALPPAPEEEPLETLWLKSVRQEHGHLLGMLFQKEAGLDLLSRVYVGLEVRAGAAERAPSSAHGADTPEARAAREVLHRPGELRRLLELPPGSAPWVTGRWVVLGDPGSGKTTLLRHLASSLAGEALDRGESPRWVPVYESLPTWLGQPESLATRLERRLRRAGHPAEGLASLCEQWAREGRLLLLLDGLDEVPREERSEAERLLRDLVGRWPDTPIVLASRPIGFRSPGGGFTELRLLPLDREAQRELLARWRGREDREPDWAAADESLGILEQDRSLADLAGNPLYLTLMAMLMEEGVTPDHNRTRLYDQIFDLLMEGKHRPDPVPMEAQDVARPVLRRLAYDMTLDNRPSEPVIRLEGRLLEEEMDPLRRRMERHPRWRSSLRKFFDDLAERTGILGPHDGNEANWRYWHRSFREALAAERLEEVMGEEGREVVLERARKITGAEDASRWAEPYALLAGRVEEPDRLVPELVEANRPLGLRALASARTLKTETVVEILGLTGDVEERVKVYQELPRLVGDGRAVLDLVERLRRERRDGNDLFWLDWVAREVGRGEPDRAGEAEALLGRFFDHIDPPPVEVFREVETGLDGKVPLWCEIPAGDFQMGSPEDEEGRFDDEGPRHRVELVSGFRLAAVPVTRAQYALFDPEHESERFEAVREAELGHHPVIRVTWWAAVSFCRWLSRSVPELAGARLPTEAEWEYACRAGTETPYWKGEGEAALGEVGWYDKNSGNRTHRVGELPANDWGLYDVHGNVREWTVSPWTSNYSNYSESRDGEMEDPGRLDAEALIGIDPGGGGRVIRGGSYAYGARSARSAYRNRGRPRDELWLRGFRVALPAAPSDLRS